MENFLHLLRNFNFDDEDFERVFISEGRTPDAICAALVHRLGDLADHSAYSIADNPDAQRATKLALTRLISVLAESANASESDIERLFASASDVDHCPVPTARLWKYPKVNDAPGHGRFDNGDFKQFSALKMFGYTVGKKDGWSAGKRTQFLADFMTCVLPPDVERVFGDEYGAPMSAARLRKVANVIASNCSNFMRNDAERYRVAISQWKADLEYLKEEFYERQGLKFVPWPTPE